MEFLGCAGNKSADFVKFLIKTPSIRFFIFFHVVKRDAQTASLSFC